ncbi:MAG: hypothetical protein LLG04_01625, partial [Parachlamydia sp.]|nr:hypothetical protein [Parachlamydia sp.]
MIIINLCLLENHQPAAPVRQKLIDIPQEDPQAPSSKIEPLKETSSDSFHVTQRMNQPFPIYLQKPPEQNT